VAVSSTKIPLVNARRMVKALKDLGFEVTGHKGDHWLLTRDGHTCQVPWHPVIKRGSVGLIMRQGNITREELAGALK
jgi:predicted RNA binding protein YcfA (HicA-like mRNA interferase family)